MTNTFVRWLEQFADQRSALGDLAHDVARDPHFPTHGPRTTRRYLLDIGADDNALLTHDRAWRLYVAQRWSRTALRSFFRLFDRDNLLRRKMEAALARNDLHEVERLLGLCISRG